ncbi:DUF4142 domain-containing protein [Vitiosangium sp. GDMCC 1.1324]|uniref:DUF4142 domain-containing protein n=1 Tax=Vitiosangium sp. (strain GDMCC 1.1324) TaxID=2138576 RepID=UPI000D357E6A|nr:DUF4142 domain-containing protein [Vitiosangium sp. GDMCC 1.1324]PTL83150.1 hypothetical protein DAT35_14170 [Vitiosangium sp. GDMCC 1.1324]
MKRCWWGRWALLGAMVVGSSAMAQQGVPGSKPQTTQEKHEKKLHPMEDQARDVSKMMVADGIPAFLSQLQAINRREISLAEIAHEKAWTPAVQQYAERIVQDHKKAEKQIADLAKQRNIQLDPAVKPLNEVQFRIDGATQATKAKLEVLQGSLFEQEYLASQVTAHTEAIQIVTFGRQLYPDLAPLLDGLLPTLREHRDQAYRLLGQLPSEPQAQAGPQPQQPQQPEQRQARPPAGERR